MNVRRALPLLALALSLAAAAYADGPGPGRGNPSPTPPAEGSAPSEEERLLRLLHSGAEGATKAFHERCTPALAKAAPEAKLAMIASAIGPLFEVRLLGIGAIDGRTRCFLARGPGGAALVDIGLDAEGRVAGLLYRPVIPETGAPGTGNEPGAATQTAAAVTGTATGAGAGAGTNAGAAPWGGTGTARPHATYVTKTRLSLPFAGRWIVANGGRERAENHHIGNPQQEYAYDFIRAHRGLGRDLKDYDAYGQEVLAPADGLVVQVLDGAADLAPGEQDPYVIPGNMVVIDHKNGEWSFLCHFQRGSILVKPGEIVLRGTVLGLCGNSGNTTEPHIHFHLQNDAVLHRGEGLPAPFSDILVDGVPSKGKVEPGRGKAVENVPEKGR